MCEYVNGHNCRITNEQCPWMFRCTKDGVWKPNRYMPNDCNVKSQADVPAGYHRVRFEQSGYLYVDIGEQTIKILNTLGDDIPQFVKVKKLKDGTYRIKQ